MVGILAIVFSRRDLQDRMAMSNSQSIKRGTNVKVKRFDNGIRKGVITTWIGMGPIRKTSSKGEPPVMQWLKEWAKPAVVIVAIGILANCQNQRFDSIEKRIDGVDSGLDRMDLRLEYMNQRMFNMNTRLSRIEGALGIKSDVPEIGAPSKKPK